MLSIEPIKEPINSENSANFVSYFGASVILLYFERWNQITTLDLNQSDSILEELKRMFSCLFNY